MTTSSSTTAILTSTNPNINSGQVSIPISSETQSSEPQHDTRGRTIICGKSLAGFMLLVWGVYTKYVYDDIKNHAATPISIGIYSVTTLIVFYLVRKGCLAPCTDRRPDEENDQNNNYAVLPANPTH